MFFLTNENSARKPIRGCDTNDLTFCITKVTCKILRWRALEIQESNFLFRVLALLLFLLHRKYPGSGELIIGSSVVNVFEKYILRLCTWCNKLMDFVYVNDSEMCNVYDIFPVFCRGFYICHLQQLAFINKDCIHLLYSHFESWYLL